METLPNKNGINRILNDTPLIEKKDIFFKQIAPENPKRILIKVDVIAKKMLLIMVLLKPSRFSLR